MLLAERLLRELKQKLDNNNEEILKYRLLTNFRLLATREKINIESALDDLVSLASDNIYKDNIGITLGRYILILKQFYSIYNKK